MLVVLEEWAVKFIGEVLETGLSMGVRVKQESTTVDIRLR